jgi:hypothetical protein
MREPAKATQVPHSARAPRPAAPTTEAHTRPPDALHARAAQRPIPSYQRLSHRRTIIPILLTCGLSFLVLGATKWVCDPETALAQQPTWMAVGLFVAGGLSLALGLFTMFQVHYLMTSEKVSPP